MRSWLLGLLCAGLASAAHAGTIFADDYGTGAPDVIGNASQLDIRSVEVNDFAPGNFQLSLRLNYGAGDPSLAAFAPTGGTFGTVALADVLIEGDNYRWAIAMSTGGAGGAYLTGGGGSGPI